MPDGCWGNRPRDSSHNKARLDGFAANLEPAFLPLRCPSALTPGQYALTLAQLAEYSNTNVEIISGETEEGQMLKNAFGGIAAILRFKAQNS